MKILDRYIAKTLFKYSLSVMAILVGVFAFFKFLEEVDDIGNAGYTLIDALIYISLTLPSIAYLLFSLIILLGVVLSLGSLAANSELVVMRSTGLSIVDITKSALKISLIFALVMIFIGEFLVPITSSYAKKYRAEAMGQKIVAVNQQGFWIKDGQHIIHVDKNINGNQFKDVTLIKLKSAKDLDSVTHSQQASFDGKVVDMSASQSYQIDQSGQFAIVDKQALSQLSTQVAFDQELLKSLKKEPKELSAWQLFKQIGYLTSNQLSADNYEVEFYNRLVKPVTLVAMIVLSIPFVFGSLRNASLGKKIFLGVVISLFFQLTANIGAQFSLLYNLNHFLVAFAPTLIVFAFALINLKRISAR